MKIRVTKRQLYMMVVLFGLYLATGELGRTLFKISSSSALIWPPAGISMALLVLEGYALWPAIVAASLVGSFLHGGAVITSLGVALGFTLQAVVGAYLLRSLGFSAGPNKTNKEVNKISKRAFLIVVAVVVGMIAPSINIVVARLNGGMNLTTIKERWVTIWLGCIFSILTLTPLITAWSKKIYIKNKSVIFDIVTSFILLGIVNYLLFWTQYKNIGGFSLVWPQLLLFMWIGLRLGLRGITTSIFMTAVIGILGVFFGTTGDVTKSIGLRIMQVEQYIILFGAIFYTMTAIAEDNKEAAKSLKDYVVQLEEALNKIRSDNQAKADFISILAHELRNPLAPISNYLELIKLENDTSAEVKNYLATIENNVHGMSRLLDDLLDVSRINQHKFNLRKEKVSIRDIINHSISTVTPILKAKGHNLSVKLNFEDLEVVADKVRLEQIVVNLLTNAIKYTKPRGTIIIECGRTGDMISISVTDNGMGIEKDMLSKIFEPFVQISQKTIRSGGLGVGLFLSKKLAELHNGSIEVRSNGLGTGSAFVVKIHSPHVDTQTAKTPMNQIQHNTGKFKILVVDDNHAATESLSKLLNRFGNTTQSAYDGESAIRAAKEFKPDFIILDIGLPDMNGYEVAKRIKNEIQLPVVLVALTGYGQEEDKMRAKEAGFDHHLTKPTSIEDIKRILTGSIFGQSQTALQ